MYNPKTIYTFFCHRFSFTKGEADAHRFIFICTPHTLHRFDRKNIVYPFFQRKTIYTKSLQVPYSLHTPKYNDKILRFVNILMKHGKKTRAIYILEVAAFLFMQTLIKIKLPVSTPPNKAFTPNSCYGKNTGDQVSDISALSEKTGTKIPSKKKEYSETYGTPILFLKSDTGSLVKKTEKKTQNIDMFYIKKYVEFCKKNMFKNKNKSLEKGYFFTQQNFSFLENDLQKVYKSIYSMFPFTVFFSIFRDFYFFKVLYFNIYKTLKKCDIAVEKPCFSTFFKTHAVHSKTLYFTRNKLSFFKYLYRPSLKKNTSGLHRSYEKDKVSIYKCTTKNAWYGNICGKYRSWDKLTNAQKNTLLFSLYTAISNVKPPLECRNKRFGGSNRQIPATVSEHRQLGYAIRWIIESAKKESSLKTSSKGGYNKNSDKNTKAFYPEFSIKEKNKDLKNRKIPDFCFFLADALQKSYYKRGSAIQKRNVWIETANANKAFLSFRWW